MIESNSCFKKCSRCGSKMTYNKYSGPELEDFWGWQCIMCGEIVDPVILQNRYIMETGQKIVLEKSRAGTHFMRRRIDGYAS